MDGIRVRFEKDSPYRDYFFEKGETGVFVGVTQGCAVILKDDGSFVRADLDQIKKVGDVLPELARRVMKAEDKPEWRGLKDGLTEFEKELFGFLYTFSDIEDRYSEEDITCEVEKCAPQILAAARKLIASEIDEYEMLDEFCKEATERVKFDSYFFQEGIRATVKKIKGESV